MDEDLGQLLKKVGVVVSEVGAKLKHRKKLSINELKQLHADLEWCKESIEQIVDTHVKRHSKE